jgi:hypothetical protein
MDKLMKEIHKLVFQEHAGAENDNGMDVPFPCYKTKLSIPAVSATICEYMSGSLLDAKTSNRSTLLAIRLYLKVCKLQVQQNACNRIYVDETAQVVGMLNLLVGYLL